MNGSSAAPAPLRRLIVELRAAGITGVTDPRCLDCGEAKPLIGRVEGGGVCDACKKRRRIAAALRAVREGRAAGGRRRAGPGVVRHVPPPRLHPSRAPLHRLWYQPRLQHSPKNLRRVRGATARGVRHVRPRRRDPGAGHGGAVRALRGLASHAVRGVWRVDDLQRPHRAGALRGLLPAAGRCVRAVRQGSHDRSPGCRQRPRSVRDLLDRADCHVRGLRTGSPVPRRAARTDALQRLRAGRRSGVRALSPSEASAGAVGGGPGLQPLLPPGARREGPMPVVRGDPPAAALPGIP